MAYQVYVLLCSQIHEAKLHVRLTKMQRRCGEKKSRDMRFRRMIMNSKFVPSVVVFEVFNHIAY